MTRVVLISDTHLPRGSRALSVECLRTLAGADLILHAGDLIAPQVLDELRELAPVEAVAGNMDVPALQALLPATRVVEVGGVQIGMIHDPGPAAERTERLLVRCPDCAAVVYGHTHLPERRRVGDRWVLNPGSPTERRRAPNRWLIVLEIVANCGRGSCRWTDPPPAAEDLARLETE